MGATREADHACPSGAPDDTPGFWAGSHCQCFCFLCCLVNYNVIFVPRRSTGSYTNGLLVLTQVSYFQLKSDLHICLHVNIRRRRSLLILRSQPPRSSSEWLIIYWKLMDILGFWMLAQVSYFLLELNLDICLHIRRGGSLLNLGHKVKVRVVENRLKFYEILFNGYFSI